MPAPPISTANALPQFEPHITTLSNGVKLYAIRAGVQEVARVSLVFGAGTRYQPQKLVANATMELLGEGSKHFSAQQIAEGLDCLGAYYDHYIDRDYAILSLYALSKHLDKGLDILQEMLMHPLFPENELQTYISKHKQKLQIRQERVAHVARQQFLAGIYGTHPYGDYALPEDCNLLRRPYLSDFHRQRFTAENCFIVASGNIAAAEIDSIARHFEPMARTKEPSPQVEKAPLAATAPQTLLIEKPQVLQSALRYGKRLFAKNHPDYAALHILSVVLGGYMGSRLMRNVREEKGYTYGIFAAMVNYQLSGHFVVGAEVGAGFSQSALAEIARETERLCTQKITQDELQLVRQYLSGEIARSLDGAWALAEMAIDRVQCNLSRPYAEILFEQAQQITPDQLLATAQKYLNPKEMTSVTVGK